MSKVLCIGDIALDVIVRLDGEGLSQLRYGSDTPSKVSTHGGGTAANVASWLNEIGTPTLLLARIGDDSVGEALIAELQESAIAIHPIVVSGAATGTVVVLVDRSGERTMLPDSGANAGLSESDLPNLDGITAAYISGYSLFNPLSHDGVHRIFQRLRSAGITTFLDPASVGTMLSFAERGRVLRSIPESDVLLLNESEAEFLSGEKNHLAMLDFLLRFAKVVVVKRGELGAIAKSREIADPVSDNLPPRVAIDTTGAGDSFAAGFISSWITNGDLKESLRQGNLIAGRCVESIGARPSHPKKPSNPKK
ncbi:MAG: hypothetical protein RLZZ131_145 [Actinomycetota bacterium]